MASKMLHLPCARNCLLCGVPYSRMDTSYHLSMVKKGALTCTRLPVCPGNICPGKDRCPCGHFFGGHICPGDIFPGKELIGVFQYSVCWVRLGYVRLSWVRPNIVAPCICPVGTNITRATFHQGNCLGRATSINTKPLQPVEQNVSAVL